MSSWGATGAAKPRSHNVNSVYAGRTNASGRAAGSTKNGLQVLGKTSTIVRRMPPPATLPSLKSEIGQDPSVIILSQGGQGWNKPVDTSENKNSESQSNSPDLRPNWAKSAANGQVAPAEKAKPNPAHSQRVGKVAGNAATNSREFPPLAAAVGTAPAKPTPPSATGAPTALTDSYKSSRQPLSRGEESEKIVNIPPPQSTGSGYIGASTAPRANIDRKIPDRYIGAPEGSRPTNQPNKRYDFRQKLAQLSMDSKEKSEERQIAQKTVESVSERSASSPQPPSVQLAQPDSQPVHTQPIQSQAGRSQDVRRLYSHPQESPMEDQPSENWGRPVTDEYGQSRPRQDFYQPQPLMSGHGDSGYQKQSRYDEPNNWDEAIRWAAPPDRRVRQFSYRGEEEWYGRSEGNGYHGGEYGGKFDNGGYQSRNRPPSNSYSDEYDVYGMYGSERRTKRRSETGEEHQSGYQRDVNRDSNRETGEYSEGQKAQGFGRNQPQQPVFRMLKRNDEKSAEYFSTRSNLNSMTEEESAETLSQLTRFGRPLKNSHHEQRQSQENVNRFNKAPGAGKPQNQKDLLQKESRQQVPAENVWKKRLEEQQQQQTLKQQEDKHTWGEAKHNRKFDYHFPVMEKDETPGWEDMNDANGYHEEEDQRREQRNRRPQKPQSSVQRNRATPEASRKPVGNRQKKRNEPEDNFSNMGEFHAEDYTISEVAPPRPFQNNFEEGFASVDLMEQDVKEKRHRRTPNEDNNRPLKPQKGAPVNKSWRESKPRRTPEDSDPTDKRKSGGNRLQNQRGPRREYHRGGNKNEEEEEVDDSRSNGSETRRFDNSIGSRKSTQRAPRPRPKPAQAKTSSPPDQSTSSNPPPRQQNQKNAKPASPIYQNNGAFGKSNDENNSPQLSKNAKLNARENRRSTKEVGTVRYGLAGVDLNNASVFVIDNQPEQFSDDQSESGEFEEVLSRKARKQRQELQRQEEERVNKEKARQDRQEQQKRHKQKDEKSKKQLKKKEEPCKRRDSETKSAKDSFSPVSATDSGCVAVSSTSHISGESGPEVSLSGAVKRSVWNEPAMISTSPLPDDFRQNIPAPIARPTSKSKDNMPLEFSRDSESMIYGGTIPESDFDFGAGQTSPKTSYINDDHAAELQKKVSRVKDIWPGDEATYLGKDLLSKDGLSRPSDVNGMLDAHDHDRNSHSDQRSIPQRQLSGSQSSLNSPAFLAQSNGFSGHYSFFPSNGRPFSHHLTSSPPTQLTQNFLAPRNYVDPTYFGPTQTDWSNMELMNGMASPSPIQYYNSSQMNIAPTQRFQQPPPSNNFRPTSRLMATQAAHPPAMNTSVPPPNLNMGKHNMPAMVPYGTHHIGPFVPPPPINQVDFSVPPPSTPGVGVVGGHRQQMTCGQMNGQRSNNGNQNVMFSTGPPVTFRNGQRRSSHNSGGMGANTSPGLPTHLTWNPSINGANTFGLF